MDENIIKPISPSPTGVKYNSKRKRPGNKKQGSRKRKGRNVTDSSLPQGKVIDDYA